MVKLVEKFFPTVTFDKEGGIGIDITGPVKPANTYPEAAQWIQERANELGDRFLMGDISKHFVKEEE